MTRKIFIIASVAVLFFVNSNTVWANNIKSNGYPVSGKALYDKAAQPVTDHVAHAAHQTPATKSQFPEREHHNKAPKMDETPHIHHFHKERMKKGHKRHTTIWYISKFIIVLCHLSLMVIGFLHIIH